MVEKVRKKASAGTLRKMLSAMLSDPDAVSALAELKNSEAEHATSQMLEAKTEASRAVRERDEAVARMHDMQRSARAWVESMHAQLDHLMVDMCRPPSCFLGNAEVAFYLGSYRRWRLPAAVVDALDEHIGHVHPSKWSLFDQEDLVRWGLNRDAVMKLVSEAKRHGLIIPEFD